jgi:hypothetical protein
MIKTADLVDFQLTELDLPLVGYKLQSNLMISFLKNLAGALDSFKRHFSDNCTE